MELLVELSLSSFFWLLYDLAKEKSDPFPSSFIEEYT